MEKVLIFYTLTVAKYLDYKIRNIILAVILTGIIYT